MRNLRRNCILAAMVLCSQWMWSQAQEASAASGVVPRLIRFAGVVKDSAGKPMTGTVGITFSLFKDKQDSVPLWLETQNVVLDATGRYTVLLGATKPEGVPVELFSSGAAQWLGIHVQGQAEQSRVLMVSVPYALKAQEAETLAGKAASQFVSTTNLQEQVRNEVRAQVQQANSGKTSPTSTAINAVTAGATNFSANTTNQVVAVSQLGTGVAINAAAPANNGIVSKSGAVTGIGVYGINSSTAAGTGYGVRGDSATTTGRGVRGIATGGSGVGVQGTAFGLNGIGGFLESRPTTGTGIGVSVKSNSTNSTAGIFDNTAGGKILSLRKNGVEQAAVDGFGNGTFNASLTVGAQISAASAGFLQNGPTVVDIIQQGGGDGIDLMTFGAGDGIFVQSAGLGVVGIVGQATNTTQTNLGIQGQSFGPGGTGILGQAADSTAPNTGIMGQAFGPSTGTSFATGVFGLASNTSNTGFSTVGVGGESDGEFGIGVRAIAKGKVGFAILAEATDASTENVGIQAQSFGPGGFGIEGFADASGGIGVFGSGPTAGEFIGNVNVVGTLKASSKSFLIDHPIDPANKYLNHASVESSELMDIYTGNAVLDSEGRAVVRLPNWFEALNRDFRYQLTAVGAAAPNLHIQQEIANQQFTIAGGAPGTKVSWQVTGVRQDAFAKAHPLQVEEDKAANERGFYIHPELFGAPREKSIIWAQHPETMRRWKQSREQHAKPVEPRPAVRRPQPSKQGPTTRAVVNPAPSSNGGL